MCIWKAWKKPKTKVANLIKCGIEKYKAMKGKEFKFDRYTSYNPAVTEFPKHQDEIISRLAETYENRAADVQMYMKAAYQTAFGSLAAKRIFPLLQYVDLDVYKRQKQKFHNILLCRGQVSEVRRQSCSQ